MFALPSYVESFGISSLEAAVGGSAVVAYDHGGPSEIFVDGETARLLPVGDVGRLGVELERLVQDEGLRTRLAHSGAGLARGYDWERVFGRVRGACAELLAESVGHVPGGPLH